MVDEACLFLLRAIPKRSQSPLPPRNRNSRPVKPPALIRHWRRKPSTESVVGEIRVEKTPCSGRPVFEPKTRPLPSGSFGIASQRVLPSGQPDPSTKSLVKPRNHIGAVQDVSFGVVADLDAITSPNITAGDLFSHSPFTSSK